jgi:putative oxidoreductase
MTTHATPFGTHNEVYRPVRRYGAQALRYLVPVGRVLFALIFVASVGHLFSPESVAYARAAGVPAPEVAVPVAGVIALAGGLCVAIGFRARLGAGLLLIFLVPVTLWMHAFWRETDPAMIQMQQVNFMKNLALVGAALILAYFGAGPISVDERTSPHSP